MFKHHTIYLQNGPYRGVKKMAHTKKATFLFGDSSLLNHKLINGVIQTDLPLIYVISSYPVRE